MNYKIIRAVLIFFALSSCRQLFAQTWFYLEGDHFIIEQNWKDEDFAKKLLTTAESDLERILARLDYEKPKALWRGKNRITIVIFEREADFHQVGASPDWVAGYANYQAKTISSYKTSKGFFSSTIPHEIAHLVLYDLTETYGNVPRWLHEGFAISSEDELRSDLEAALKTSASQGKLLPLVLLTIVDPKQQDAGGAMIYYAESQAFVRFLIDRNGPKRFQNLILELAKGASFEEAVQKSYEGVGGTLSEIEGQFLSELNPK